MSFVEVDGIVKLIEELLQYCWPTFLNGLPCQFNKITYNEAMEKYGTDKPDTRFENTLKNCTEDLGPNDTDFGAFYISFPECGAFLTDSIKTTLKNISKELFSTSFLQMKCSSQTKWDSALRKHFGDEKTEKFLKSLCVQESDVLFVAFGNKKQSVSDFKYIF